MPAAGALPPAWWQVVNVGECAARQAHACPASLPAMSANLGQCSPGRALVGKFGLVFTLNESGQVGAGG